MSAAFRPLPIGRFPRPQLSLALLCLACIPVGHARADQAGASGADPTLVVTRTVNPRIAYRGVPLEDNPVRAQATMFPAGVFHGAIDGMVEQLAADGELGERGAGGTAAMLPLIQRGIAPLGTALSGSGRGVAPIGPGASSAGGVGGATRDLASTITGSLPAMISPAQQGGGQ